MQPETQREEILCRLEESLWKDETRFDSEYMGKILHPDFLEFGRSGRVYTREETLSGARENIRATLPLKDFRVHMVSDTVTLVTYVSEVQYGLLEIANRSSLWVLVEGLWKLWFHQGTPVPVK